MEILGGDEMRRVDRRTIDELGIPALTLMEAAGRGIAEALAADYPEARSQGVLVLCGGGSNGGDGLVAARYLAEAGVRPRVVLLAPESRLVGDAAVNLARARAAGIDVCEVTDERGWSAIAPSLKRGSIVLDAMLGTGTRGEARGLIALAIDAVNSSGAVVVAADLPSGIDADALTVSGSAIRADRTYTLARPKLALVLGDGAERAGRWRVIPIGIPDAAVRAEGPTLEWFDRDAASALVSPRAARSHKGTFGHLLAVAGSRDKSGAAVLVARGALRSGVGLVTVATPASARSCVAVQQAELMSAGLPETSTGELSREASSLALALARERDAVVLGPGLGTSSETVEAIRALACGLRLPLVLDADGLNAFALEREAPPALGDAAATSVLTPHPGEASRLLGTTTLEVESDRLFSARRLARESGAVVVLKGHRTLVAAPDGRVAVNATGNPGLATGGTGDVLAGVIGALLARGTERWDAARLAVWVHGDAGDRAALRLGQDGMIASDVVAELPAAWRDLG